MNKISACKVTDVEPDSAIQVAVDGHPPIAIYNLDGEFFATADICTHGNASLAEGFVEDGLIVCPFHEGSFDIKTGAPAAAPCVVALATYPVTIEDETVMVTLE